MAQLSSPETGVPVLGTKDARLRRVVMPLVVLLVVGAIVALVAAQGRGSTGTISGGGSTLAQPLIESAAVAYRDLAAADNRERPEATGSDWVVDGGGIDYEATGSLGGILRLDDGRTDFAISDYPLSAQALADAEATQFPIALGAVAVVHNLDNLGSAELRLDAKTLTDIYQGEVTTWDDDAIAALNPDLNLPSLAIKPVRRSDGSGSTYGFTSYLATDSGWSSGPGVGPQVDWPTGEQATRSSGMIEAVSSIDGAIGYVEPRQAQSAGLNVVALANPAGTFTLPDSAAIEAAIDGVDWAAAGDFSEPVPLSRESAAYPITVGIYALVTDQGTVTTRSLDFLAFVLDDFDVTDRGYVELPENAKTAVRNLWSQEFDFTAASAAGRTDSSRPVAQPREESATYGS